MGSLQMKDSNREAFEAWHYEQYLIENPNIDITNAKYIYDYAHKNVLVCQLRESHFTAWQAAKAQAVPEWISVEDGLPSDGQDIIAFDAIKHCVFKDGEFLQGYFEPDTGHEYEEPVEVTHWMPIPQPPKAQEPAND